MLYDSYDRFGIFAMKIDQSGNRITTAVQDLRQHSKKKVLDRTLRKGFVEDKKLTNHIKRRKKPT